jgi:hypothetical protein
MAPKCAKCQKNIHSKDLYLLKCQNCKKIYHVDCTNRSKLYDLMTPESKTKWTCSLCSSVISKRAEVAKPQINKIINIDKGIDLPRMTTENNNSTTSPASTSFATPKGIERESRTEATQNPATGTLSHEITFSDSKNITQRKKNTCQCSN